MLKITDLETLEIYACMKVVALCEDLLLGRIHIASDCLRFINELKLPKHLGGYCMIV